MKKLLVIIAALAMGVTANAATVEWGGAVANENDGAETASEGTIFNLIYLGDADFSSKLSGLTYDKNTGLLGTGTGKDFTATDGQELVGTHTLTADEAANYGFSEVFDRTDAAGGVNGNYLMVMYDAATPDYYWAGQYNVSGVSDMTSAGSIFDDSWAIGYGTTKSVTDSSAGGGGGGGSIPEPTSGLLMLLGMAGLALRRKMA